MDLFPAVTDPTGAITQPGSQTIALQPGDYLVSYKVSATLNQPGYMQVTPSYGGAPHLEYGVYFATTATGSSAVGSAHFILPAPSATTFSLTYSGSVPAQNGEVNLTFLRLRRPAESRPPLPLGAGGFFCGRTGRKAHILTCAFVKNSV